MTDRPTDTTDASLSECGHERFERNHYFHGKLMTARDMAAEQAYHAGQRRAHARSVAGRGVAWGLESAVEADGDDALTVTVERGYAIDGCGRPVVVPQTRETTVTDPGTVGASTVSVWLDYAACLKESVPVDGAESACEDECAYNRVLEVYDVEVEAGPPDNVPKPVEAVAFPGWDDLESVSEAGRERPAADDHGLATIAESFREHAGDADAGEEGRVFLGAFESGSDGEWVRTDDRPASRVYTNDMLYAATARHAADFGNPHEVTLTTAAAGDGGAAVRVRDDGSDQPDVTVASTDGSVDVGHAAASQRIDLSVEAYVDEQVREHVEARLEPLERHATEQALKHKALAFRRAAEAFGGEAGEAAAEVSRLARRAADARLAAEDDAEAAERLVLRDEDGAVVREIEGDVYVTLLGELLEPERAFHEAVAGRVTDASAERLERALERLEAALEPEDPGTLAVGSAQDDVADAVEWLEPTGDEEEEPESGQATFTRSVYRGARGDVVGVDVDLQGTESATLTVGSDEAGYRSTLDVRSGGGGSVTVLMNTYLAGRTADESDAFGTADDADDVTVTRETDAGGSLLAAGSYDLELAVDGDRTGVGALALEARSTDALDASRAPAGRYDDLTTVAAVDAARAEGALDDGDVEPGDAVVADVAVTGVFGAIAAETGETTVADAAGLRALVADAEDPLSLTVAQTDADGAPKRFDLERSVGDGAARFLLDEEEGRLLLVVDSAGATVRGADGDAVSPAPGEEYRTEFAVGGLLGDETVADTFSMAGARETTVPNVVGSSYDAASATLSESGLSATATYRQIDSASYLRTAAYGGVVEQAPAPGTSVAAGSEVTLTVLTSRPVGELEGIGSTYADRLAEQGIEWVHELERVDPAALADAIRNVPASEVENWVDGATDYRVALDLSLQQDVTLEEARAVSAAFRESGRTDVAELDDDEVQSVITAAANDDGSVVTAESAGTFLEHSRTLRFDPNDFEHTFDPDFDTDFDPRT